VAEHKVAEHEVAEHEVAERARRRIERHLVEARLPLGKTIDTPELVEGRLRARPECCSLERPISFSSCKSPVANSLSKPPSPGSTNTTC
jgi:hypothetical protein